MFRTLLGLRHRLKTEKGGGSLLHIPLVLPRTVSTLRKVDEYMDVHPLTLSFKNVQAALILGYIQL